MTTVRSFKWSLKKISNDKKGKKLNKNLTIKEFRQMSFRKRETYK